MHRPPVSKSECSLFAKKEQRPRVSVQEVKPPTPTGGNAQGRHPLFAKISEPEVSRAAHAVVTI